MKTHMNLLINGPLFYFEALMLAGQVDFLVSKMSVRSFFKVALFMEQELK